MLQINQIPHLKLYRVKTYLNLNEKRKSFDTCALLNTINLESAIKLMEFKLFDSSRFNYYYEDVLYEERILNRTIRINNRTKRTENYNKIRNDIKSRSITPHNNLQSIQNRNFFYGLHEWNNIFFNNSQKIPYRKKSEEYFNLLKSFFTKAEGFTNKIMMIDTAGYDTSVSDFNNPIYIIYYLMRKRFDLFQSLENVNIIFVFPNAVLRLNPSECNNKSFNLLKMEFAKVLRNMIPANDDLVDAKIDKEDSQLIKTIASQTIDKYNLVGDTNDEDNVPNKDELEKDEIADDNSDPIEDPELLAELNKQIIVNNTGRTAQSIKRDEELRKKQATLKLEGKTIKEITENTIPELKSEDVAEFIQSSNPNIHEIRYPDFEKEYNANLYRKDVVNIFADLSERSLPMYIIDINVEDTSDDLNLKETWTIKLEDANRQRHTIKVDMPKFIDDKFMYLGGNKKIIIKQQLLKPIVKTEPDTVQIVTNYNKMFVRRTGDKVSLRVEQLKKYIANNKTIKNVKISYGDASSGNLKYNTTLEYDHISQSFIEITTKDHRFMFSQELLHEELESKKIPIKFPEGCNTIIGITKDNKPIYVKEDQTVFGTEVEMMDFLIDSLDATSPGIKDEITSLSAGKKFMYSRAKSMNREVPVIILTSFFEGLSTVLKRAEIEYYFTDKNPRAKLTNKEDVIRFSNGYLVYKKYPIENSLLLQGLSLVDTASREFEAFDDRDTYLDIFDELYSARSLGRYFLNVYESMIDPITKEVLQTLGYPDDLVGVLLFSNQLLADNSFISELDMTNYRIRSNEIAAATLYKVIANEYNTYRNVAMVSNKRKISVKQDAVLKELKTSQIVEDYSVLNPIVELEKSRAITCKGPSGLNVTRAYTQEKRGYDKSMSGIMAISTSPDGNCGVVRSLALEPNIKNARGFVDIKSDHLEELKDVNLFSPGELLTPIGAMRDDANRTAMATKQSKHLIPVSKSSPVLISNGAEQTIPYHLGNDFCVVAEEDGKVVEINEATGIVIVKYKSGKCKAIDTNTNIVKNGAGGFYLPNKLVHNLKVGQNVKKNEVLAYHDKFFSNDINGTRFNIGTLAKIAISSTGETFEDSSFVTQKLSNDLSSEIVMKKAITLEKNAEVSKMVKIGQPIKSGEELIVFETSYNEEYMNDLLKNVGEDLGEEIRSYGKKPIKSKYTGTIADIKVYSTVEDDELSPSLKKIVKEFRAEAIKKSKLLDKYKSKDDNDVYKCGMLLKESTGKVETKDGKIHGEYVGEGVLIEFFIQYLDVAGVGD